jgi:hypothetical protein
MLVPQLNSIQLLLEPLDVFFLCHLHLLQDFFLRVELSVEIFSTGYGFIYLMLELHVLLLKDLNLTIC